MTGARSELEKALADTVVEGLDAVDGLVPHDQRGTWMDLARFTYQARILTKWPGTATARTSMRGGASRT